MRRSDVTNVIKLATLMNSAFQRKTRDNGETFYCLKDDAPDWMTGICHDAHNRMFPDDIRYEYIKESIEIIASFDEDDATLSDLQDAAYNLKADCYNNQLTNWLSSHGRRQDYVNEAMEEVKFTDIIEALQAGQLKEKMEVYELVFNSLEENVDVLEEMA